MLGFLTRVENAYIQSGTLGFASLTDDVRGSPDHQEKSSLISATSESVHTHLNAAWKRSPPSPTRSSSSTAPCSPGHATTTAR
jgi:hypothetical protein